MFVYFNVLIYIYKYICKYIAEPNSCCVLEY